MKDNPHKFEIDLHKRGSKGFKRIDEEEPRNIRDLTIPSQSSLAARLGKIVNSKHSGKKK